MPLSAHVTETQMVAMSTNGHLYDIYGPTVLVSRETETSDVVGVSTDHLNKKHSWQQRKCRHVPDPLPLLVKYTHVQRTRVFLSVGGQ